MDNPAVLVALGFALGWTGHLLSIPPAAPQPCHCRCECVVASGANPSLILGLVSLGLFGAGVWWYLRLDSFQPVYPGSKGKKGVFGVAGKALLAPGSTI